MADIIEHEDKEVDIVKYELGYHLVPSLGEEDLALHVGNLQKAVERVGGTPISESYPQAFELSYTMKRLRGGKWHRYDSSFFGWMRFTAPAGRMKELEEELRGTDSLIRHILFRLDLAALAPAPVRREPAATIIAKREVKEEKAEISDEELNKQVEQLIG